MSHRRTGTGLPRGLMVSPTSESTIVREDTFNFVCNEEMEELCAVCRQPYESHSFEHNLELMELILRFQDVSQQQYTKDGGGEGIVRPVTSHSLRSFTLTRNHTLGEDSYYQSNRNIGSRNAQGTQGPDARVDGAKRFEEAKKEIE